jgi:hypothetical protein
MTVDDFYTLGYWAEKNGLTYVDLQEAEEFRQLPWYGEYVISRFKQGAQAYRNDVNDHRLKTLVADLRSVEWPFPLST